MKIGMISFISLFFILAMTSCGFDREKHDAANLEDQPAGADADNAVFSGTAAGIALDEMTFPVILCGDKKVSYARISDKKDMATEYLNLVNDHKDRVWVKMKIVHPEWPYRREIRFEIIEFGLSPEEETACDCEKQESTLPVPPVVETPAPVVKKPAPVKDEPKPVAKKEIAAKDLHPCFTAKDYEVITIIKEKGKVVSETTTNLGDVVDASSPEPSVDAGE